MKAWQAALAVAVLACCITLLVVTVEGEVARKRVVCEKQGSMYDVGEGRCVGAKPR
jgi:nitrite reductase/ring-hydroxylating ferredoxin subunit